MHPRFSLPGPFWYEDLLYFVIDEAKRLPARLSRGANFAVDTWTRRHQLAADLKRAVAYGKKPAPIARREIRPEPDLLDEPMEWSMATEPLAKRDAGAQAAIALHHAAHQQLDATIYALDRLCEELRPLMQSYPLKRHAVEKVAEPVSIEESLRALREIANKGAKEKPAKGKNRKPRSAA